MANPGDRVKIETDGMTHEGLLLPGTTPDTLVLKLKSGYNIGIEKTKATVTVLTPYKETKKELPKKLTPKKGLPSISILHTGGTIASRVDYRTGGVYAAFTPEDLLAMFPELATLANINSRLVSNMWSDDLRFLNFIHLAKAIEEELKKGVDGIIVGIGTDNLAVASAAIAFMVQHSPIPILFVGSQRSSDRGSTDAALNLISAAQFIVKSDYSGVAICMHHTSSDDICAILPPTKSYKLHSSRRDAFKAINDTPIALVEGENITFVKTDYLKKDPKRKAIIAAKMEDRVGLLRVHVNMFPEEILVYKEFKGLVIDGTGLGHTPGYTDNPDCAPNKAVFDAIKTLVSHGTLVVITTQTLYGGVHLNVYSRGRDLQSIGVISGENMLANTALVKLSWLLAHHTLDEAKMLIGKNIVGEINTRLVLEEHHELQ